MKSKETYDKVAETFNKKADKHWAKAKNDEGDFHYGKARKAYDTAKRAEEQAKKQ